MSGAPARSDLELRMMESMVDGAYALGMGFAEAAQAETGFDRQMTLTDAFHRCFHAVRMGIRLSITLRATPKPAANDEREVPERETVRDRPSRDRDYDRDRQDYEPVSLARFLATLRGVTRDAERLNVGTDQAAHLHGLLAEVDAEKPSADVTLKVRPPASPTKARFLGSAAPVFKPAHPPRPRRGGASQSGDPGFFR